MDALKYVTGTSVPLETVLCTGELKQRPSRAPDYQAENQALLALAQELTNSPGSVLQRLVDVALELCRGHSAGISLLEEDGPPGRLSPRGNHFRWHAVAGQWAPLVWNTTTPRDDGPCGTVLDRNITLLFSNAHLYYTQFAEVHPLLVEGLLVPFHVDGQAVGTVWVIAHDETRKFDAEDQRLLESLATFAATAYQTRLSITAQAKANQDLQAEIAEREGAQEALREADRRKNEFLAMLAHELRNPLAPVRNGLAILNRIGSQAEAPRQTREMMERQVEHMTRLLNDLLDMSRITSGKIELHKERVELADVVRQVVETCRSILEAAGQQLALQLSTQSLILEADRVRLAQIVENLLTNAIKYSEQGGRIELTVEREGSEAVLRVHDGGIGITGEMLPRIWDLFVQAEPQSGRSRLGLGIGLTVVQNLVRLHGGSIEVQSPGLGKGSAFTVRLPLAKEDGNITEEKNIYTASSPVPSRRIMVVDDNSDEAESLGTLLRLMGNEVSVFQDGTAALAATSTVKPEVAFLDVGMPKMDGYELARKLRRNLGEQSLLVAVTGYGMAEDRRRSQEAGFDEHLVKPAAPTDLQALLTKKK